MPTDEPGEPIVLASDEIPSLEFSIRDLNQEFGVVAVFERYEGNYALRCYPRRGEGIKPGSVYAACYVGQSLRRLAAAALLEYTTMPQYLGQITWSRTEVKRWVA
jgi:hypothetical protein